MNRMSNIARATGLLAASLATSSHAQTAGFNPSWYISPSVNVSQTDSQIGTEISANGIGLRFGAATAPSWDMQMGLTGTRTSDNTPRFRQTTLGIDGLYMLSRNSVRPFVLLGTGLQYDEIDRVGTNSAQTSPYLSLGLGVQIGITDQWALQMDVRRSHAFRDGNSLGGDSANNNYATLSLNYNFDNPTAERRTAALPAPEPELARALEPATQVAAAPELAP